MLCCYKWTWFEKSPEIPRVIRSRINRRRADFTMAEKNKDKDKLQTTTRETTDRAT